MSCAYIREFGLRPPGSESEIVSYMGNAILSTEPFEDVAASRCIAGHAHVTAQTHASLVARRHVNGSVTRVKFGGEGITVGVAHLHSRCTPAERARQMATYLESFPASGRSRSSAAT